MKKLKFLLVYLCFVCVIPACADTVESEYNLSIELLKKNFYNQNILKNTLSDTNIYFCQKLYRGEYKQIECLLKKLKDPYTKLLLPAETKEEKNLIQYYQKRYGFGLALDPLDNTLIQNIIKNSPASKAKLQANDRIQAINNIDVKHFSQKEINKLLETPSDIDEITLDIKRGEYYFFQTTLKSQEIEYPLFKSKILNNNILYVQLESFISRDISSNILKLIQSHQETYGLILDLKNNTGGLFANGLEMADLFLDKNKVITVLQKRQGTEQIKTESTIQYVEPVVVLANKESSSSAEILIGALKDNNRALIVGEKTYGKGSMQKIEKLPSNASLHITTATFTTPNGNTISHKGIEPDIYEYKFEEQLKIAKQYIYNYYMY